MRHQPCQFATARPFEFRRPFEGSAASCALHGAMFFALADGIPRSPQTGRRCLARSTRCGRRHERCPWCGHVPDVLDDRCDVLSRLWTIGRTGARQYLDSRLVQLPALRPRVVRAHSERTTRRFGSRRGLRAARGEHSAALTRVAIHLQDCSNIRSEDARQFTPTHDFNHVRR